MYLRYLWIDFPIEDILECPHQGQICPQPTARYIHKYISNKYTLKHTHLWSVNNRKQLIWAIQRVDVIKHVVSSSNVNMTHGQSDQVLQMLNP